MADRELHRDLATVAPPDHRRTLDLQVIHHCDHVARHQVVGDRQLAARAPTLPATVDRHDVELVDQRSDLVGPVVSVAESAMEQDHGVAIGASITRVEDLCAATIDQAMVGRIRHRRRKRQRLPALLVGVGHRRRRADRDEPPNCQAPSHALG
jgi:hypothetical protein